MSMTLQITKKNNYACVVISRPEALNALNEEVLQELHQTFKSFEADGVRGVILTGAGEKAFVAGADISAMKNMSVEEAQRFGALGHSVMKAIENFSGPVLACVNGFALGGGLELALSCDFILASENAKFGLPEVNLGLVPGFGGTQRLAQAVGLRRAKQMIYSAQTLSAQDALGLGLVNAVYPPSDLLPQAEKIMTQIVSKGPQAIKMAKRLIQKSVECSLSEGLSIEQNEFPKLFETPDLKEGISAFLEKRPAQFSQKG